MFRIGQKVIDEMGQEFTITDIKECGKEPCCEQMYGLDCPGYINGRCYGSGSDFGLDIIPDKFEERKQRMLDA